MTYLDSILLGLVEGITEFLPISSTGHLILASAALKLSDQSISSFIDAIQAGAILAVVFLYPARFKGLLDTSESGFRGARALGCLALSTAPAMLLALLFEKSIKAHLFGTKPVALAMAVGALWIFWADKKGLKGGRDLDSLTPADALKIGLWQCLALWPGMSRSACSILGAMFTGLSRKASVEYSFLAAVPLLAAAFAYELLQHGDKLASYGGAFFLGLGVSFASAYFAVKFFVSYVSRRGLTPFAWYRLAVAALIWMLVW